MPRPKCRSCNHEFDPKHAEACGAFCSEYCAAVDQMYTDQGIYRVCFSCRAAFRALEPHHRKCAACAQAQTGNPKPATDFSKRDIDGRVMRE
jgi:hypothetical protein